ncbi:hypothetical protein [Nocardia jejuensis]|uniref:hypothetical protein n=1 Tax=Nocardia jejuensis TaxID=328049 RepID=UPI00082DC9EA|nr:hypothetical protein [Nocardia jejuensis]
MITEHFSTVVLAVENLDPVAPPGSGALRTIGSYIKYLAYFAALVGIVYGGGRFAVEKWNGGSVESPKIIAACLVGGAVIAVATPLLEAVITAAGS